jgi:hypothetical protein
MTEDLPLQSPPINSKFLTRRPHIQFMRPQTRLLPMQPQIRLPDRIRAHLLARLLVLAVLVRNRTIRNRVHNVHALLAHLARQRLRELAHRRAACAVGGELCGAPERAESAGEYDRLVGVSAGARLNIDSIGGVGGKGTVGYVRLSFPHPPSILPLHDPQTPSSSSPAQT